MLISYGSDLHTEFGMLDLDNDDEADVLVLAGDVLLASRITDDPRYEWFFENISNQFDNTIYIMGNHEHYDGDFQQSAGIIRNLTDKFKNIHFLDKDWVTINDVTFFGATFWTSMRDRDPHVMLTVGKAMSDFHLIKNGDKRFTTKDAAIENELTKNAFELFLQAHKDLTNDDNKVVVVSHHTPSWKSMNPIYDNQTELNYGYHNEYDQLIMDHPEIKLWIHGHTHTSWDYMIGETRVVCNPRGYLGHEKRANFFELKTVEV